MVEIMKREKNQRLKDLAYLNGKLRVAKGRGIRESLRFLISEIEKELKELQG
jgi:hypothetical protein